MSEKIETAPSEMLDTYLFLNRLRAVGVVNQWKALEYLERYLPSTGNPEQDAAAAGKILAGWREWLKSNPPNREL